jgi:hypothetical protein
VRAVRSSGKETVGAPEDSSTGSPLSGKST